MAKNYAFVWTRQKDLPYTYWEDGQPPEEGVIKGVDSKDPNAKEKATAIRAKFIQSIPPGSNIFMEMGGAGGLTVFSFFYKGVNVYTIPPYHLKRHRGDSKKEDHVAMYELATQRPELFYKTEKPDALNLEIGYWVKLFYTFQKKIRIPLVQRLIGILVEEALLEEIKRGTKEPIIDTAKLYDEIIAESLDDESVSEVEEEATTEDPKKPEDKDPVAARIILHVKNAIANDPDLKAAALKEKSIKKTFEKLLQQSRVFNEVFSDIDGMGPITAANIIGFCLTPRKFIGDDLFHSQGNFQAYFGWTLSPDGRIQRIRRDANLNFKPQLKTALFNWGTGIVKRKTSPWRLWLDEVKLRIRNGWQDNAVQYPGYAEKRTLVMLGDSEEVRRFIIEKDELFKRVKKGIAEVCGAEKVKEFGKDRKKFFDFMTSDENKDVARNVWTAVFNPELWKSHIHKQGLRKLFKYLTMYIFNRWAKLEGMSFFQHNIDWVDKKLENFKKKAEQKAL